MKRLINPKTLCEIKQRDELTSFRGDKYIAWYYTEPDHGVGKISVKKHAEDSMCCNEFYITVFGLEWVDTDVEYMIVGDTDKYEGCLIYPCGISRKHAEEVLDRVLNHPTENDLYCIKDHKNIRIKSTSKEKCWWNDPFLAN